MKVIESEKLDKITGGSYGWVAAAIAAVTIFLSGVFEGYTHPKKCNNE